MKTLAVALLAVLVVVESGPLLLFAALALSAAGDAFLSREDDRAFLAGLASFLAAHLAYIALLHDRAAAPAGACRDMARGGVAVVIGVSALVDVVVAVAAREAGDAAADPGL